MSDHLTPEQLAHFKLLASNSMGLGIGGWQSEIKNVDLAALLAHIDAQAATIQRVWNIVGGFTEEECSGANECCAEPLASRVRRALDGGQE